MIEKRIAVINGNVATEIHEIPIELLESLPLNEVNRFHMYLKSEGIEIKAINRTFSALKSLLNTFHKTEDEYGNSYLSRNVMDKIELHKEK